ncbi:MAG TPA: hypothetical protein VM345_19075 [Acidimicrobiales bacterium]|jgi:hypothetical protein|nr:hypothetical protein [Acidimicrobiales bacterium]
MRRTIPGAPTAVADEGTEFEGAPDQPAPLRTEYRFELPIGYLDKNTGTLHKQGVMRMATARDELLPLSDARLQANPSYLTVLLLTRVITQLGTLPSIDTWVVEELFAADLAFLQDLYRRINQEGHTRAAVTCPSCSHSFTVDVAGGSAGGR